MKPKTLLMALLAISALSCGKRPEKESHSGRIVELPARFFDLGAVDTIRIGKLGAGEIAVLRLSIRNTTDRPAVIESYDRVCGCTSLDFNKKPILPGEDARIEITFDSRGTHGWQLKPVDLMFAGAKRPLRLLVEAEVK